MEGLFIGYVSEIQQGSNNLTKSGTIVTPVDFQHLREVFVITTNKQDILEDTASDENTSGEGTQADPSGENTGEDSTQAASGETTLEVNENAQ